MKVWAIADLHLAFGAPDKSMEVFGPQWANYAEKIRKNWLERIHPQDLVLIPGDISWAMTPQKALPDLEWIDALPGVKVLLKGNHDYWWSSFSKVQEILPPSLHLIQNNSFTYQNVSVGGSRLWDSDEYTFDSIIHFQESPVAPSKEVKPDQSKIFKRELERLELSLKTLDASASVRIAMTHYPPIGLDLKPSRASTLLEKYKVDICVFGHLHFVQKGTSLFGKQRGVAYYLTSCDYLDFEPLFIREMQLFI